LGPNRSFRGRLYKPVAQDIVAEGMDNLDSLWHYVLTQSQKTDDLGGMRWVYVSFLLNTGSAGFPSA
jgi:hypothetical protein